MIESIIDKRKSKNISYSWTTDDVLRIIKEAIMEHGTPDEVYYKTDFLECDPIKLFVN